MEFDIKLSRNDYYHFLMNRNYSSKTRNISRYVGALAILGSVAVLMKNGLGGGLPLMLLGIAFMVWTPFIINYQAGKMEEASANVSQIHYSFSELGFILMPPGKRPKDISFNELIGVLFYKEQIVIYKDVEHAYIFPRKQLIDVPEFEEFIKGHLAVLDKIPS